MKRLIWIVLIPVLLIAVFLLWQENIKNVNTQVQNEPKATSSSAIPTATNPTGDTRASSSYKDLVRVTTPLPESTVTSPLTIRGEARGPWYFEASFPVVLTDWDGRIIAEGHADAQRDWMTEDYVPFESTLSFTASTSVSNRGSLILKKDNPSGLPQNDDAFEYTVYFK